MRYIVWLVGSRDHAAEVYARIGAVDHMMDGAGGRLNSAYLESDDTHENVVGIVDYAVLMLGERVRRDSVGSADRENGNNRRERIHYNPHMFDGTPVDLGNAPTPGRSYNMDSEEDVLA